MLRDAELKGRDIMADSYSEKQRVEQALIQLRQVEEDFRFKFRSLLEAHINLLTEDDASEDRRRFRGIVSQVEQERAEVEAVEPATGEAEAVEPDTGEAEAVAPAADADEAVQAEVAAAEQVPSESGVAAPEPAAEDAAAPEETQAQSRGLEWDAPVDARSSGPAVIQEPSAGDAAPAPKAQAAFAAVVWDTPVATEGSSGGSGKEEMPSSVARAVQAAKAAGGFDDDVEPVYERDVAGQAESPPRGSLFGRKNKSREAEDDPFAAKEPRDFEW